MVVVLMILAVHVTEQDVWVCEISYFWFNKVWFHRQGTEYI
jgi:hypothetical protein